MRLKNEIIKNPEPATLQPIVPLIPPRVTVRYRPQPRRYEVAADYHENSRQLGPQGEFLPSVGRVPRGDAQFPCRLDIDRFLRASARRSQSRVSIVPGPTSSSMGERARQ